MTGTEFENLMAEILWKQSVGYWTLVIPKNKRGAQPFDLIAIGRVSMYAADCKVCSQPRFPLSRIEDNQWLAMEALRQKRNDIIICFFCLYDGDIYIIPYAEAVLARERGQRTIPLRQKKLQTKCPQRIQAYLFMPHEEIVQMLGREV